MYWLQAVTDLYCLAQGSISRQTISVLSQTSSLHCHHLSSNSTNVEWWEMMRSTETQCLSSVTAYCGSLWIIKSSTSLVLLCNTDLVYYTVSYSKVCCQIGSFLMFLKEVSNAVFIWSDNLILWNVIRI